jgi:hypothetical protein
LIDKSQRAFSITIESSKAFEIAIRKPRHKFHHAVTWAKGELYQFYVMLLKHHGKPAEHQDPTLYYVLMSLTAAIDFILLGTFMFHITHPFAENWNNFGWAFFWAPPFLFVQQPIAVCTACMFGSIDLFKIVGNINSSMVCVTYPLVMILAYFTDDDPLFHFVLLFLMGTKFAFSSLSSKVVHTLNNPRFHSNQQKIDKFMIIQSRRTKKREEVLGVEANRQLMGMGNLFKPKDGAARLPVTYTKDDEARMRERLLM